MGINACFTYGIVKGLVVASPATLVQWGNLHDGSVLLGLAGLLGVYHALA